MTEPTTKPSVSTSPWNRASVTLLVVLALALGLRIWGIWFGLPHIFHNDEGFEVLRALRLGTGDFDFTRIGKGGYFYLLFVEYGVLYVVLLTLGVVGSAAEFGEYYVRDPSAFYLIGRTTTAVLGTLTVYLVYRIGRMAYSTGAGLLAAGLLALNVLHSYLSHLTTVDVPMTCLTTAALYFAVKIVTNGTARDYWWAALLAAMAMSTKMSAVLVLVPLLVAHCYFVNNSGGGVRQLCFAKRFWQAATIFVVAYVVATPGIVLYFEEVFWTVLGNFVGGIDSGAGLEDELLGERALFAKTNLFVYYVNVIIESMTLPVFVVCIAAVAYALWKRQPVDVILVVFVLVFYIVISSSSDTRLFYPRYILPALPVLALLGGRFLSDVAHLLMSGKKEFVVAVLVIILGVLPTSQIVAKNYLMTQKDTRAIAKEWIEANISDGEKIFIEGYRTAAAKSTVPLQNSAKNLRTSIEVFREEDPGKARYFRMALKQISGKTYDLVGVQPHAIRELQYYKDLGVQFFVLRPDEYGGSRRMYEWPHLVEEIKSDPDIELMKRFEPDPKSRPGPLIEVYRVNSNVDVSSRAE